MSFYPLLFINQFKVHTWCAMAPTLCYVRVIPAVITLFFMSMLLFFRFFFPKTWDRVCPELMRPNSKLFNKMAHALLTFTINLPCHQSFVSLLLMVDFINYALIKYFVT